MNAMPNVTIRVTKVLATYKSGKMRFRGVPVCPATHEKTSKRDFYNITTTPSQVVFEPEIGQVWKINGEAYTEEKPRHYGPNLSLKHLNTWSIGALVRLKLLYPQRLQKHW
jgi:hypothetical protein